MNRWTCPACGRTFGRNNQGHFCVPVRSIEEWLADQPPGHHAVAEAVLEALEPFDEAFIEAADVGLLIKRSRTFAELRPKRDWLVLSFVAPRRIEHDRIRSATPVSSRGVWHKVRLSDAAEVDDTVREWLLEAYEAL